MHYANFKIMRKITFVFAFFTAVINAQTFPNPYCGITEPDEVVVEEITSISFNNVVINNINDTDVLIDFTATSVPVASGQTYSLKVYGNTQGNFETNIVAFIDWNNNGVLNDAGEIYEIGTLTNSTGTDGIFVAMDIPVPTTANNATTRIRITKTYTDEESVAVINPCAISFSPFGFGEFPGYGQALDFILNVNTLSSPTFDAQSLSIYPVPAKNSLTITYKSTIGSLQIYNQLGQEVHKSTGLGPEATVDVSNLAVGIYILKLFNEKEAKTFKIIKE